MKSKKVWRYYCDHCRKGFFKSTSCIEHEKICCSNPKRECPACIENGLLQKPIEILNSAFEIGGEKALSDAANNCPYCMLSVVIEWNKKNPDDPYYGFDFNKQREAFWAEIHAHL